jgi:hypothetical protein
MKNLLFTLAIVFITSTAFGQKENSFHLDQSYPISDNATIYLSADDAKVTITGEDRNDVAVKIDYFVNSKGIEWGSREFHVEVVTRGGDLHIDEYKRSNSAIMGYVNVDYKIEIKAPYASNWDIKGDDDDYLMTNINGEISINADDADVRLKNCQGNRFFFDLDDGDIIMDQGQGQLTARMDDGDIEIRNGAFQNIDYRGDDGDIAIETSVSANAMFKFSGDDSTIDLVITQGGGTFTINHDDGNIDYDNNFRLMDKSRERTVLSLTGGRGKIIISGDDIRVNLASTQSN